VKLLLQHLPQNFSSYVSDAPVHAALAAIFTLLAQLETSSKQHNYLKSEASCRLYENAPKVKY